jgi:hypothetical protein
LVAIPVLGLVAAGVLVLASSADAAVSVVEAENMHSVEGYGTSVGRDDSASGHRMLTVDSDVSVEAPFTLSRPAAFVQVMAHTDRGVHPGALTSVLIDGVNSGVFSVNSSRWAPYWLPRTLAVGQHTLTIRFRNARARNLYLDVVRFWGRGHHMPPTAGSSSSPAPATTAPTTRPPAPPTRTTTRPPAPPTPAPPTTSAPPPPSSSETQIQAYVTGFSWFDNTPPGSSSIAFPVVHSQAGGTGTYADPITVAVGHVISGGTDTPDYPAGTRFYVPNLRRYFIVEDACGDGSTPQNGPCHQGFPAPATTWIDVWVGGQGGTSTGADQCMDAITDVWTIIKDPAPDYAVVAGQIYGPLCTQQFGNTAVKA